MMMTERRNRVVLPCVVSFQDYNDIKFELMGKFYGAQEIDHNVGTPLVSIKLETLLSCQENEKLSMCRLKYN